MDKTPALHSLIFHKEGYFRLRSYAVELGRVYPEASTTTVHLSDNPHAAPAALSADPSQIPQHGGSVRLDASASEVGDSSITSYEWDFGDGSVSSTSPANSTITHMYSSMEAGRDSWLATVTVIHADGGSSIATKSITQSGTGRRSIDRTVASSGMKYSLMFGQAKVTTPPGGVSHLSLTSNLTVLARPKVGFKTRSATARKLLAGQWKSRFQTRVNLGTGKGAMVGTALVTAKGMTGCFRVSASVLGYHARPGVLTLVGGKNLHRLTMRGTAMITAPQNHGPAKINGKMAVGSGTVHKIPKGCGNSPTAH